MKIAIDGFGLQGAFTGTQRYLCQLLSHLLNVSKDTQWSLLLPTHLEPHAFRFLRALPNSLQCHSLQDLNLATHHWDVLYHPSHAYPQRTLELIPYASHHVLSYLDLISLQMPQYHSSPDAFDAYRIHTQQMLSQMDHLVAISQYTQQQIHEYWNIPTSQISVVSPGVALPPLSKWRSHQWKIKRHYWKKHPYLFCIGTDFPHKNLWGTLKLFEAWQNKHPSTTHLLFAGPHADGGEIPELKQYVQAQSHLKSKVHFLGPLKEWEVPLFYEHADVLLYLSRMEGFGFPPLEALMHQTPVLASNQTSIPEVLGPHYPTWDPDDLEAQVAELQKITTNPSYRNQLLKAGHERLQHYTWEHSAKTLWDQVLSQQ